MKIYQNNNETMKITKSAFYAMLNHLGSRPAESGGALFGYEEDNIIRRFVPDKDALTTRSSYTMNTGFLNPIIKKLWNDERLSLLGISHSHPYGSKYLSNPDKNYFNDLLINIPRKKFYTPIIFAIPDGGLDVFPYVFEIGSSTPKAVSIELVSDDYPKQNEVQTPKEPKENVINNFVLIVPPKEETTFKQPDKTINLSLVFLSIALIFSFIYIVAIHLIPIFFLSFFKFFALWN